MNPSSAFRHLACIVAVVAGVATLASPPASAQSCPPPPALSAIPRGFTLDRWTPAATEAPIFFVVPDPQAGLALFAPVHATLLPPGTLGPGGTPIDDFRIMLFGRAGDRVKAASFTPTPLGQSLPGTTCCSSSTRPGCRRSPASCTCNEGAIQTSRGRSPSTMIRHRTRLCLRS